LLPVVLLAVPVDSPHRSDRRIAPKVTVPLDMSKDQSQSRSRALVGTK